MLSKMIRGVQKVFGIRKIAEDLNKLSVDRRTAAIYDIGDYLRHAELPGDYMEFGTYCGRAFSFTYNRCEPICPDMKYWAFDSFEGLPDPDNQDIMDGDYTGGFYQGQYSCTEQDFRKRLKQENVDMNKVHIIKGWFNETLTEDNPALREAEKVAFAWIDCDFYESTVPVLEFLTSRITVGTVIVFDDWRAYRNLGDRGEQLACAEWLERNPQIKLNDMFTIGWHGIAFTVASC